MKICSKTILVNVVLFGVLLSCTEACPGRDNYGFWRSDEKNGHRCILKCSDGYQPSGCNVLRQNKEGSWNYKVPVCVTSSMVTGKNIAIVAGTGLAFVAAAPLVIGAAGFGAGGVVAGSLAAFIQTPFTPAGSLFALSQSAGVLGLAATTKVGIGAAASGATYAYLSSQCERE